jgi:uncharacterized protein (TIGR00299 family) protein
LKAAYLDCFSGISGDMSLGAFVDAGVPAGRLRRELERLPVRGWKLSTRKVRRAGLRATKADVSESGSRRLRRLPEVEAAIGKSSLPEKIKKKGLAIFRALFEAEARVHGSSPRKSHLHELGGLDTIVDIIGTLVCLEHLGVEKVICSPVNVGSGEVATAHGAYPVPAPATAELLRGVPLYSSDAPHELTTPTGAAIVKCTAAAFGGIPLMRVEKTGLGAGDRDLRGRPNVLRVLIGQLGSTPAAEDGVVVMETNIDDMNPQLYAHVMERLFEEGALDVYLTQVIMKKGRPGVKLTALCSEHRRHALAETILRETTSIGLRYWRAERAVLERKVTKARTELGTIRVKESSLGGEVIKAAPEYEDLRKAAKRHGLPLVEVSERVGGAIARRRAGRKP